MDIMTEPLFYEDDPEEEDDDDGFEIEFEMDFEI